MTGVLSRIHQAAFSRQLKWRLTLTYSLVALATVFVMAWWVLVATVVYLDATNPEVTWAELVDAHILPALRYILPSAALLLLPAALLSAYFGFLVAHWLDRRLADLAQATLAWRQGNFSVKVQSEFQDEIDSFGQDLNHMAADLEELMLARQELAAFKERSRLGRDLHDSVKQHLAAAAMQIGTAQTLITRSPLAAQASLEAAAEQTHLAQKELSAILEELRPVALVGKGLPEALRLLAEGWSQHEQVDVQLTLRGDRKLSAVLEQALYRLCEEALANAARHSRADRIQVELNISGPETVLTIQDNGQGFDPAGVEHRGYGLKNIRERVEMIGGRLDLQAHPGDGVKIEVRV
jgi:two-component system, NarL family, sensor histidine kinase LiaS